MINKVSTISDKVIHYLDQLNIIFDNTVFAIFTANNELEITITSCSECHNCFCLNYDEDIMANWFPDDSNLNTICQSCNKPTVPLLTVTIAGKHILPPDPFSIPYLNPLVLQKELEYVLNQEGGLCIANAKFPEKHPIIYWNLVWTFERINVQTHLPNLYLKSLAEEEVEKTKTDVQAETEADNGGMMQPVEEGSDPLTQELAALGMCLFFFLMINLIFALSNHV